MAHSPYKGSGVTSKGTGVQDVETVAPWHRRLGFKKAPKMGRRTSSGDYGEHADSVFGISPVRCEETGTGNIVF